MKPSAYLAFQGGGALGMAHLGAWQIIADRFDVVGVAGTSAGSIVAALCAAGYDPSYAIKIFRQLNWQKMVGWQSLIKLLLNHDAKSDGKQFYRWLQAQIAERFHDLQPTEVTFAELYRRTNIFLAVVACNLNDAGEAAIVFSKDGEESGTLVAYAVRASTSVPLLFTPVSRPDKAQVLVDGGLLLNFPANLLHRRAQDEEKPLIGVRFQKPFFYLDRPRVWETLGRTMDYLSRNNLPTPELKEYSHYIDIAIDTEGFASFNFKLTDAQKDKLLANGRAAAEKALDAYQARLAQRRTPNHPQLEQPTSVGALTEGKASETQPAESREIDPRSVGVTINNQASNQGAQGVFNAPVNVGLPRRDDERREQE